MDISGQTYQLPVGVVEKLSHPVVVGQDIGVLPELLQAINPVNVAMTRSQSKAQRSVGPVDKDGAQAWRELPFADAHITAPARVKPKKTRRQRRQAKLLGTVEEDVPVNQLDEVWGEVPDNFGQLQREDSSLARAFEHVTQGKGEATERSAECRGRLFVPSPCLRDS